MFKLEQNYRSTQSIVKAANSLIRHNSRQIPKDVYSKNDEGDKIQLRNLQSDKEEAIVVSKEIRRLKRSEGLSWSDFAILYRTNSQSRSFEEQFLHDNVPYRVFGGMSFYQRKEIKDIIAYFRVVCNPDDEEAIKRIINYPARSIGETTIGKIAAAAQNNKVSFWDVIQQPDHYDTGLNKGTQAKLQGFVTLIQGFIDDVHQKDAYELGTQIIKVAGISADLYRSADVEAISRQENLEEFLSALQEFVEGRREEGLEDRVELSDYLQEVSLLTDADKKKDDLDRVSLMTVHSAKGLEFPAVFVVGLEDGIFPSQRSMFSMREMEEERRLLYVAITRAEKHCMLTCAKNRWRFGKMEMLPQSRFLKDINPDMLDAGRETLDVERGALNVERQHHFSNASSQSSIFKSQSSKYSAGSNASSQTFNINRPLTRLSAAVSKPASSVQRSTSSVQGSLHEGTLIEHQRFGKGTIISIEGEGENQKATVKFVNTGTKQLLLKFAKFKVVER
jgi:DNA helicase-2/ATP-dependent DNA helicase PcrA